MGYGNGMGVGYYHFGRDYSTSMEIPGDHEKEELRGIPRKEGTWIVIWLDMWDVDENANDKLGHKRYVLEYTGIEKDEWVVIDDFDDGSEFNGTEDESVLKFHWGRPGKIDLKMGMEWSQL